MDETSVPCAKLCGDCKNFNVLDDLSCNPCRWFGVCGKRMLDDFDDKPQDIAEVLDWVYDYGKRGDDDCDRPDEWFEEG